MIYKSILFQTLIKEKDTYWFHLYHDYHFFKNVFNITLLQYIVMNKTRYISRNHFIDTMCILHPGLKLDAYFKLGKKY